MSIIERIKRLDLPDGQYVVIGSGILDALGLREAGDIDLVVTPEYFAALKDSDGWTHAVKHGDDVLTRDDLEVWLSWGSADGSPNFAQLHDDGMTVDGIRFASPTFVRDWKIDRARPKDAADVELLNGWLDEH